ncbi:DUF4397 domain-containing protein [Kribbella sp. NPDC048915]|uniref:DUF4397 domain-containing protein n=1 Tax=Kribbella sp. NPDC048915 TaxID=3155148 RepID=UPI0033C78A51
MFPALVAIAVVAAPALVTAPAEAATGANLYFVQGLPGRTLDLSVDGRQVAAGVAGAKIVGPFAVTAGKHLVTARQGSQVVIQREVTAGSGASLDVVVHLPVSPSGAPVITTYANKLDAVPKDKGALRVAHDAAVGPADIRVNGQVLFQNVANGESLDLVVPAATYKVDIVPTGATSPVVLGPLDLPVAAGVLTRVFAIGVPSQQTMTVALGTIKLPATGSDKPGEVNAGTGGQAAGLQQVQSSAGQAGLWVVVFLAALGVAVVTARKAVRR